ncbi:MAG TPA: radical SAM protein [Methanotrichaceae archaeon]|nr:radical SAM protein [Methanotrichaceae archaeon]HQF17573.1 radical SAM protein [Methanotrichaceae archaeon]HQI92133.1 radical SAM protein [Methanotrichaceae archaeon]
MIDSRDIHVIQRDRRYVVFHPESLSLFSVAEDIGRLLKSNEIHPHTLGSKDRCSIDNILNHFSENLELNSAKDLKWKKTEPRTLNLIVSQDCNLRCAYCYADHGTYGAERKLMSYDTAKTCIDKLLSKEYDNHIVFFGGEPLLNFSLIKEIDSYINEKNLHAKYTTITNGTIMNDEIKNFINNKFLNLWISMDGPKDINDVQRFGRIESVHDRVVETIDKLHTRSYPLIIKSIVTKKSAGRMREVVEYISSLDIDSIDLKPVKDAAHDSEFFMNDEEYLMYIRELADILVININKLANGEKVKLMSHISSILMQMTTKTRMTNGCSAGREIITITPDGYVYPCEKYIGLKEFNMGNVHDEYFPGEKFERLRDLFYNLNIYNSIECGSCWARFLCGGVCHWQSYVSHGDLSQPTERRCLEMKAILEALLPEIAEIFSNEVKTKNMLNYLKSSKYMNV